MGIWGLTPEQAQRITFAAMSAGGSKGYFQGTFVVIRLSFHRQRNSPLNRLRKLGLFFLRTPRHSSTLHDIHLRDPGYVVIRYRLIVILEPLPDSRRD